MFLALTTPAADLVGGMRRLGMPAEIAEMSLLMYRFLFLLTDTAEAMNAAQTARLGHVTYGRHMKSLSLLIANLMPRAFARARSLEVGLAARGWRGELRVLSPVRSASALEYGHHCRVGATRSCLRSVELMSLLEARGISHTYPGDVRALNRLDLKVEAGRRLAILGANGSGKTTLLLHLNGTLKPKSGEVLLGGEPMKYDSESLIVLAPARRLGACRTPTTSCSRRPSPRTSRSAR